MKKYVVAAAIAVLALMMSAFAASLNVDGGTLQAGADDDLACAENVRVDSYITNDDFEVEGGAIRGYGSACNGLTFVVQGLDGDDNIIAQTSPRTLNNVATQFHFYAHQRPAVEDVETMRVLVRS